MAAETKLKPCPFCGGVKLKVQYKHSKITEYAKAYVRCLTCGARGALASESEYAAYTKDAITGTAASLWNRRREETDDVRLC